MCLATDIQIIYFPNVPPEQDTGNERSRIKTLFIQNPDEEFTSGDVMELAGFPRRDNVNRGLKDLLDDGVLIRRYEHRQYYWRLKK